MQQSLWESTMRLQRQNGLWVVCLIVGAACVGGAFLDRALRSSVSAPRDRALSLTWSPNHPEPFRLLVIGTSLSTRASWPQALVDQMERCLAYRPELEVIAQPGAGSSRAVLQAPRLQAAAGSATLVVLELAINDADVLDGVSMAQSRANHQMLITALQQALPQEAGIILMTTNPTQGLLHRLKRWRLPSYYALYSELAQAYDLGLADIFPRWRALPDLSAALPDGLHPAPEYADELIVPVLQGLIVNALGPEACQR